MTLTWMLRTMPESVPGGAVEVLSCPPWCTASHSGDEGEFWVEHTFTPDTLAGVDADVRAVRVDTYESAGTLSDAYVWVNDRNVTAAEARRIAAALLVAADTVEAESRRTPAADATAVGDVSPGVATDVGSGTATGARAATVGGAK
jgi:hypothetical protein